LPVFSNILTEIPQFFRSFRKRLGLCPIKKKQCATAGAGDLSRTADQFQPCLILRTGPQGHNECWPHANLLQLVSHHGTDSVRDLGLLCRNKMLQPRHGINFSKGRRPGVLPGMWRNQMWRYDRKIGIKCDAMQNAGDVTQSPHSGVRWTCFSLRLASLDATSFHMTMVTRLWNWLHLRWALIVLQRTQKGTASRAGISKRFRP